MYDLDLVKVNHSVVSALALAGVVRRLIGPRGDGCNEILDLEREIREAAAECQRVLELIEADRNRALLTAEKGGK